MIALAVGTQLALQKLGFGTAGPASEKSRAGLGR
jgi:hypothetical protein